MKSHVPLKRDLTVLNLNIMWAYKILVSKPEGRDHLQDVGFLIFSSPLKKDQISRCVWL